MTDTEQLDKVLDAKARVDRDPSTAAFIVENLQITKDVGEYDVIYIFSHSQDGIHRNDVKPSLAKMEQELRRRLEEATDGGAILA